jgi:hypothetical protein
MPAEDTSPAAPSTPADLPEISIPDPEGWSREATAQEAIEDYQRSARAIRRREELDRYLETHIPRQINLGTLHRCLVLIEELKAALQTDLQDWEKNYQLFRLWQAIELTPGYQQIAVYIETELGQEVAPESIGELERRLAKVLDLRFLEVRSLSLAEAIVALAGAERAAEDEAIPSQPDGDSTPKDQLGDTGRGDAAQASKASGRRGRQKGKNYIREAVAELIWRTKNGGRLDIPDIAKAVGCSPQNLRNSTEFLQIHRGMKCFVAAEVTYGEKAKNGSMEAYAKPKVKRNRGRHAGDPYHDDDISE